MIAKTVKISELKPNPNNPRIIKDAAFKKLVQSIKDFPEMIEAREIVVNTDMVILGGNMRYRALKEAGITEVPVKIVDWPDDKQREFVIKDNVSGGEWDYDALANQYEIEELSAWGLELPEMTDIQAEVEEDEAPEVSQEPPVSKLGEIYQLGRHRVMCGDSTDKASVELLMAGEKADMVFTDPPYGYSYESNHQKTHKMLKNDDTIIDVYELIDGHIVDNTPVYICAGFQTIAEWLALNRYTLKNLIVWKKNNWSMGDLTGAYAGQYEFIIYSPKGRVELVGGRDRDVWEFDREPPKDHPTTKPVGLIAKAIQNHKCSSVLDLFLGSGSTLIACEQTDRTCYGMELDPKYVDVIRKRYWKFVNNGDETGWQEGTPVIQ